MRTFRFKFFIDYPQSHPVYQKIQNFFSDKKRWNLAGTAFAADYVVCVESVLHGVNYSDTNRIFVATEYLARRIEDVKKGTLKCLALIDLSTGRIYLPDGGSVSWYTFSKEYCIALDEVL
jgi:hypothetical protein